MLKAISVHQPWAGLIATGQKTVESRRWFTSYRGPLVICSTKQDPNEVVRLREARGDPIMPLLDPDSPWWQYTGAALCIAILADCRPMTTEDAKAALVRWEPGMFAFRLEHIGQIYPVIPVRGRQGLWTWNGPPIPVSERFLEYAGCPSLLSLLRS